MTEGEAADIWTLSDLCTPWCVHVVATLKIANFIADGTHQIDDLARRADCDRNILHAVLGHLVQKGLFEERTPGEFHLNEPAKPLLDPVVQLSMNLDGFGGRMAHAWSTLLKLTRSGEPAYKNIFGRSFWEDLNAHPNIHADFDALIGPNGHGTPDPQFEVTSGWERIHSIVDIGGGTGAMLAEILRLHPHLKGILVDQPNTVARSGEIFQAAGVMDRVRTVGQSFFNPLPEGYDLYLLRGIINDWPDREAAAILRRCAEAASRSKGRVVVLKSVGPDNSPRDLTIEMVLLGGRHRTVSEFRSLASEAGLEVISAEQQPGSDGTSSGYFVVECVPF